MYQSQNSPQKNDFITEKLWQTLPKSLKNSPTIMYAPWPEAQESFIDQKIEDSFILMADFVREVRRVKHDFGIPFQYQLYQTKEQMRVFH